MEELKKLDGFSLKIIAIITMAIDHTGAALFPDLTILRCIGRIAFPIFCFLLVEGFFHTKNINKYIFRLFLFAIISEIPFDLALFGNIYYPSHQNVFLTLFIGLCTMYAFDMFLNRSIPLMSIIMALLGATVAQYMHSDYGMYGILIILSFYLARCFEQKIFGAIGVLAYVMLRFNAIRLYTLVALIPIYFYNGKRGKNIKYVFYIFYPLHLIILAIIRIYLGGPAAI